MLVERPRLDDRAVCETSLAIHGVALAVHGEDHVVRRERFAVVPANAWTQVERHRGLPIDSRDVLCSEPRRRLMRVPNAVLQGIRLAARFDRPDPTRDLVVRRRDGQPGLVRIAVVGSAGNDEHVLDVPARGQLGRVARTVGAFDREPGLELFPDDPDRVVGIDRVVEVVEASVERDAQLTAAARDDPLGARGWFSSTGASSPRRVRSSRSRNAA
ncbi:MAG: hypothetical protein H6834_16165 [Planctomycetes bacterium]|nr:hypothetical protein [Planctomycetota bacterium]